MKPYKVEATVTNRWKVEVHAESGDEAIQHVEDMTASQIEDGGDFVEVVEVVAVGVESLEPEDDEDSEEIEPEPGDTVTGQEVEVEDV